MLVIGTHLRDNHLHLFDYLKLIVILEWFVLFSKIELWICLLTTKYS